jgi:hypothetical protein
MSNPLVAALEVAWTDLKNWIETEASTAIAFLLSFFKEAISEEEAALFPAFQTQAVQIFNDAVKTAGLTVQQRVALVVVEATADLAADVVLAKNALFNSWAWAIAHQQGIIDGNQGTLPGGTQTGG